MNPYWNRYTIIEDEGKPTWSKHNNKQMHPESATPKTLGQENAKQKQTYMQAKIQKVQLLEVFFHFCFCIFLI